MQAIPLAGLLIYTFGAFAYGALVLEWLRELGRPGWAGRQSDCGVSRPRIDGVNGALLAVSFLWFCTNIGLVLLGFAPRGRSWQIDVASICLAFAFPPLIMHITWGEVARAGSMSRWWRAPLWLAYAAAIVLPAWSLAILAGPAFAGAGRLAGRILGLGICITFVCAAVYSIALIARQGDAPRARERQSRRWTMGLLGLMVLTFLFILYVSSFTGDPRPMAAAGAVVEVLAKSLPLIFMFVGAYHENRFQFFDLFVKRGVSLVLTIGALAGWFALVGPILERFETSWAEAWIDAIVVLPVVVALPWVYAWLGAELDRRWLGRRFSPVDAVKHFIGRLRSATTEEQLVQHAQAGLEDIFGATATVVLGPDVATVRGIQEIPIRSGGATIGWFLMGPRSSEAPYFSQDITLLASLADVFSHVLENTRLQTREQAQERRARELTLHASRSELKALRAQINPHFLFNALNSIAGLIHREPAVADRTIEQLADVFRYALRGAESEWAVLDDELEFVRAYLEVERARFGSRLQIDLRMADDVRGAKVPTMMVQTLVENAVKHGVGSVRGQAVVRISARQERRRLVVSVTDNGPGFREGDTSTPLRAGGYGLANVRQRLSGYFGAEGDLDVRRDVERQLTIVSVSLPLVRQDPQPGVSPATDGGRDAQSQGDMPAGRIVESQGQ